jgi:RNA polymerase sigma-70 factor (ECF subfamily)
MMSVDLSPMSNAGNSPIDLLRMDYRLVRAPTSTSHENWVAAGKPCLRQNCGHHHGNHIPSEDMECNECDCLGFVGFAHPDHSGATPATEARDTRNGALANVLMRNKGFRPRPISTQPARPNRGSIPIMTAMVAESSSGTGDLGAGGTNGTARGYPTPIAEPVSDNVGVARPDRLVGPSDPAEPQQRTTKAELTTRFERDVIPLRAPLYRRAMRLTCNRADAENLLQDTMLSAYVGFHSFREGTNLNAWLHRILTNNYINAYRQKQRRPVVYTRAEITDELMTANVAHSSTGLRSAEDEALDTLPDTEIQTAMKALPEQFRLVVYYADVQDLKYRQIAEIMHIPQGTVMSRLHRGRRQLRRLLGDVPEYSSATTTRRASPISCNEAKPSTVGLSARALTS